MSCSNSACGVSEQIKAVQGQTIIMTVQLVDENTGKPRSILSFLGATGYFPQESLDTALAVSGSLVSQDLAEVTFTIDSTNSKLLKTGDSLDFEIEVNDSGETVIAQVLGKLDVAKRLFA